MRAPDLPDVIYLPGPTMSAPEPPPRKRRSGSATRQMTIVKPVRFTDSELADAEALAAAEGKEVEDYLRDEAARRPELRGDEPHVTSRANIKYLRMTPELAKTIAEAAQDAGLSFGSYVRARGLKKPVTLTTRRAPVENEELRRLQWQHGRAASNLYQVMRALNFGREVPLIDAKEAVAAMQAAAEEIIRTLGRAPKPRRER